MHFWIYRYIPSYVATFRFSLNEPIYILKVKEERRTTKRVPDIYEHNISTVKYYLRETYLKMVRSKSIFVKQLQKISFAVVQTFEILETFIEVEMVLPWEQVVIW